MSESPSCCESCQPQEFPVSNSAINFREYRSPLISFILLLSGLVMDYGLQPDWFSGNFRFIWYAIAYLPVGLPVLQQAYHHLKNGSVFTEFFLMGIATIGAFWIGEYPEGVGVMLFYSVGELFQQQAVRKARANIKALLDVRPVIAHLKKGDHTKTVHPKSIQTGDVILVKPGERVPLDGSLLSGRSSLDTSALTGESKPRFFETGDQVLAGMINQQQLLEVKVSGTFDNSAISRILTMVQQASARKAKTELFIRSFAKIYTPVVVLLAALLVTVPALVVSPYVFDDWLYRGLVFLVISCPCALVISIPLGYFGGIGAASRNGILVKGSNYLDALRNIETMVFDKTGTLTKGSFEVREIRLIKNNPQEILPLILAAEQQSTHPVARAIVLYLESKKVQPGVLTHLNENSGRGIEAILGDKRIILGNEKLMNQHDIKCNHPENAAIGSIVHIAVDSTYQGYIIIADHIKEDAAHAIALLKKLGIKKTIMLSGDHKKIADAIGKSLNIDRVYADLMPDQKAQKLDEIMAECQGTIAYAGDGINDAPVLALSDVGIAMGGLGSDAAIETADVVIQTDQPSKIATAVQISRATRNIVWQNIILALGIKAIFLVLGAMGLASLWEAVFADVGVALLAVLNAVRIQKMKF